jgi:hypothetical protein
VSWILLDDHHIIPLLIFDHQEYAFIIVILGALFADKNKSEKDNVVEDLILRVRNWGKVNKSLDHVLYAL